MTNCPDTTCCPPFDPAPWEGRELSWVDKAFVHERVRCFFHIPIGFGKMMSRVMQVIIGAGAKPEPDLIVMCDETSKWRSEVYLEVTKDVPGLEMTTISGNFISKVFDGPYKDSAKWYKAMCAELDSRGLPQKRMFAYYTTCPECSKKHGHNYVVLLAEV